MDEEIEKFLGVVFKIEGDIVVVEIQLQEVMFKLGVLYWECFENYDQAVAVLEGFNECFFGNIYELDFWYQFYLVYMDMGNNEKVRYYVDKILEKYLNIVYVLIIKNLNYVEEFVKEEWEFNCYYDEIYVVFIFGNYCLVFDCSQQVKDKFGVVNLFQFKFVLFLVMSIGNMEGKEVYVEVLCKVVACYFDMEE